MTSRLIDKWDAGFSHFRTYVRNFDTGIVPFGYVNSNGFPLGRWAALQREGIKREVLPRDKAQALLESGFTMDQRQAIWDRSVEEFKKMVRDTGSPNAMTSYISPSGFKLGAWIKNMRHRRQRGVLQNFHILDLDEAGFVWQPIKEIRDEKFRRGLSDLKCFVSREGHSNAPSTYRGDGGGVLKSWILHNKAMHQAGRLSPDRTSAIESLGVNLDHPKIAARKPKNKRSKSV